MTFLVSSKLSGSLDKIPKFDHFARILTFAAIFQMNFATSVRAVGVFKCRVPHRMLFVFIRRKITCILE